MSLVNKAHYANKTRVLLLLLLLLALLYTREERGGKS